VEHPLVKELRDQAARNTKTADNPFGARKETVEWRAADEIETTLKSLHDPENQPSQFGTVPLETYEKVKAALKEAVGWLESVERDTNYGFDLDFTPRNECVIPRLKAALETSP
jgi:hypothetical protein